jgi:hypothetical protein
MVNPPTFIQPGDWVRFYRDGKLVIAVVEYLGEPSTSYYDSYNKEFVCTDHGRVHVDDILEVRHAK